ncbi:MAG TPA: hypothetical protein VLJ14_00885 [Ktedonobacterales bacterium]|nr:hypothetical protein [Ktedonobacterales bacterium]
MRHARSIGGMPATRRSVLPARLGLGVLAALLLTLAACGTAGNSSGINPGPSATATSGGSQVTPAATGTPAATRHAYLFSRVEYPLQIEVAKSDTVTLTLAPSGDILTVTPAPGNGVATVGAPIPLPTDLENYQDVGAAVETQATDNGPVVWQLTSPQRQSLLAPAGAGATPATRQYAGQVTFTWQVRAVAAGQNSARIVLQLYFVYLDGSQQSGAIEVSQAPIPMVAVDATPLNTTLPPLKLPLTGLTWLAGFLAVLRFLYGAYKTINDVAEPVRDAVKVAGAIQTRMAGSPQQPGQQPIQRQAPAHPYAAPPDARRDAPVRPAAPRALPPDPADWPTLRMPTGQPQPTPRQQRPWPPTPGASEPPRR